MEFKFKIGLLRVPSSDVSMKSPPLLVYEVEILKDTSGVVSEELREMAKWCRENVGVMGKYWDVTVVGMNAFIFLNAEDAMAFKLTWG